MPGTGGWAITAESSPICAAQAFSEAKLHAVGCSKATQSVFFLACHGTTIEVFLKTVLLFLVLASYLSPFL